MADDILETLQNWHTCEATALPGKELATRFNTTRRGVRMVVTRLRQEGYPICSSDNGYWYGKDAEDIEKTARRLESQIHGMSLAIDGLRRGR